MAFCIKKMQVEAGAEEQLVRVADAMIGRKICQVIDLACLDDEDIEVIVVPSDVAFSVRLRDSAKEFEKGWATLSVLTACPTPSAPAVVSEPKASATRHKLPSKTSVVSLKSSMKSFTMRVALGRKVAKPASSLKHTSLACKSKSDMEAALKKVHVVFLKYAEASPRFMTLEHDVDHVHDMQLQSYRMGSRSARVVAQRARSAEAFFLDCKVLCIDLAKATPFQVALWVRSRCVDGCKSAAAMAASTLRTVEFATDWKLHLDHPLVRCQVMPAPNPDGDSAPAASARTPTVSMVREIEKLVKFAETPQLRCIAGLVACLAFGATRFSDAQASKDVYLTKDAITGSAFLKNKKTWTRWFCSRNGFDGDWAGEWMKELSEQGLPGPDFILWAPNSSFDEWLPRHAEYHDIRRSLHFILHSCMGLSVEEAVDFTPHSFRHFLVEAGQQLRAIKACERG